MALMAAPARPLHVLGVEVPTGAHTLSGFRAWIGSLPDAGPRPRATFCSGGVHVDMSPQDDDSHAPVVAEINRVLGTLAVEDELGMYFAPPSWFTHAAAGVSTEPDGFLVRFRSFKDGRVKVNPRRRSELLGAPDMVVEVVRGSSARKDLIDLVHDYARAGVREYWLVDARGEELDFRILVLAGRRFRAARRQRGGWLRSSTLARQFRLRRITNLAGLADYRLDVRS